MSEHTIEMEASGVRWDPEHDLLVDLKQALTARPELLGPAVAADLERGVVMVTITVDADDEESARQMVSSAFGEELVRLGFADDYVSPGARQAVIALA